MEDKVVAESVHGGGGGEATIREIKDGAEGVAQAGGGGVVHPTHVGHPLFRPPIPTKVGVPDSPTKVGVPDSDSHPRSRIGVRATSRRMGIRRFFPSSGEPPPARSGVGL
jgi:hypothetical protein